MILVWQFLTLTRIYHLFRFLYTISLKGTYCTLTPHVPTCTEFFPFRVSSLQSDGLTRAITFPSYSGRMSASFVISSWITVLSKSSQSVLKKNLGSRVIQLRYYLSCYPLHQPSSTHRKLPFFGK